MTKPQTDIEEVKELSDGEAAARGAAADGRSNVQVGGSVTLTPEQTKARSRRNLWIALSVLAFIVLVFAITLTQMQASILDRPL